MLGKSNHRSARAEMCYFCKGSAGVGFSHKGVSIVQMSEDTGSFGCPNQPARNVTSVEIRQRDFN